MLPDPRIRYPLGSRVVLAARDRPGQSLRVLSEGLAAAGGASLSPDASHVLFVGMEAAGGRYGVWSCRADGTELRLAVDAPTDCGAAAFLADGRIVYSARTGRPGLLPGSGPGWALFVASGDGAPGSRITFSGGQDLDPAVLQDGRIVYASWLPPGDGRPAGGGYGLFTVHPDGSGAAPLHGVHGGSFWKLLPRQGAGGDLFFVAVDRRGNTQLAAVDWRAPMAGGLDLPESRGVLAVEPAADGTLWLSLASGGLRHLDQAGRVLEEPQLPDPGWQVLQGVEVLPRPRPQGHLSMVDDSGEQGSLLCLDARLQGERGVAVRLRSLGDPASGAGGWTLGEIPLEEDGSFFARVPADRPLLLDLLGEHGQVLATGHAPFWVRPKEVRCCVGCHEDPETAPPNRQPLAVRRPPVVLGASHFAEAGQ